MRILLKMQKVRRGLVFCKERKKYLNDIVKDKKSYCKMYLNKKAKNNLIP